jgi:carboxyl-terminal processing protease
VTYGGGRQAKLPLAAANSDDAITAPAAPQSAQDGEAKKKQAGQKEDTVDLPGGLLRLDPRLPSLPSADEEDAKNSYYTVGGRLVKGGGGIGPDVAVAGKKIGELERSLLQQNLFYDFAGYWLQRNVAPLDQLANKVDGSPDVLYNEFVGFVRRWSKQPDHSLEPLGLQQQLDNIQAALGTGDRTRAKSELGVFRQVLNEERFKEFESEKDSLKVQLRESLLGRLIAPTQVLSERASTDPQVRRAFALAKNDKIYQKILTTDKAPADDNQQKPTST